MPKGLRGGLTLTDLQDERRILRGFSLPTTRFSGLKKTIVLKDERLLTTIGEYAPDPKSKGEDTPSRYRVVIIFTYLEFQETRDKNHPFRADITPDEVWFFEKPSKKNTRVLVTCTCPDFYWTWWWYVDKGYSLAGSKFPHPSAIGYPPRRRDGQPYGTIPGSRNDQEAQGICKHIYDFGDRLKGLKIIKD